MYSISNSCVIQANIQKKNKKKTVSHIQVKYIVFNVVTNINKHCDCCLEACSINVVDDPCNRQQLARLIQLACTSLQRIQVLVHHYPLCITNVYKSYKDLV